MAEWLTLQQIAAMGSAELPRSVRGLSAYARRQGWFEADGKTRQRKTAGRPVTEFHRDLLPKSAQLVVLHRSDRQQNSPSIVDWDAFERLSKAQKQACEDRANVLDMVETLVSSGLTITAAVQSAVATFGVSERAIHNWRKVVADRPRNQWLPMLAPKQRAARERSDIHPEAWAAIKSDFLRPDGAVLSVCIRRAEEAAEMRGWGDFPTHRTLRRRLEAEVPKAIQILARKGRDAARMLFPAQRRSVSSLHAMEAVNVDGHRCDVFVRWEDGRIERPHLIAIQDLYSRKIVAWRISESENKEIVRLTFGDLVTRYGIPEHVTLDNGRAFASKWITGGIRNRFRFKVRDEDPNGLLKSLGVAIHWAQPGHGQSKPIERAFRELAERIAKNPVCAGAYTGNAPDAKPENYGSAAVPIDVFRQLVDQEIAAHNAQTGRRTETAKGRSFDETFEASYADAIVRWPTDSQRSLWLLAAEKIRCRPGSGEIHFQGNRYWAQPLNAHAGRDAVIRFDPDALHSGIRVYDIDDRFICDADCVEDAGFYDIDASRKHARNVNQLVKLTRKARDLETAMQPERLGELYGSGKMPKEPDPVTPKIKRLAVAVNADFEPEPDNQEFEEAFSRGLRLVAGGRDE
ncbi:MAG: Mu transposase C-terminal domain-containing protein [Ahrensia sp.]|nr:Mu transposase C-terminal domain-containing protein [Ahrensia sp.]